MAKARAKRGKTSGTSRVPRRSAGNQQERDAPGNPVPDVFRELLAETAPSAPDESSPRKKRKVEAATDHSALDLSSPPTAPPARADEDSKWQDEDDAPRLQTIVDESETGDSDMDWEDVDLDRNNADYFLQPLPVDQAEETLQIAIGNDNTSNKPARARRKAATAAERAMRLNVHKMHVLCLLYHSHIRNAWCNDKEVQASLKRFRTAQINSLLTPDPNKSQFQAAKGFSEGLALSLDAWKKFKITSLGMRRAKWARNAKELEVFKIPEDADPVMDISDFRKAAIAFEGSADTGAMLFCAFLRAVGVEARLVCSLQPLPFSFAGLPTVETTAEDNGNVVYAETSGDDKPPPDEKPPPLKRITRIGRPGLGSSSSRHTVTPSPAKPKKTIPHPRYPVYWVEAFNAAQQKWVAVDPIATRTIGKPSRLEPPLSDPDVCMAYAVAFESDGVAKDVTRRYAKAYNAKTRKCRVESTENGARWWRKAQKLFRSRTTLDRDQVEDAELARREAQEEMPRNVQDFKDHPYYVLERHLRHNEVIHPKREIGKINVGTAASTNLEPIFRRRDVHQLKSADRWYRLGREIKPGEQPLKHSKPRRAARQKQLFAEEGEEGDGDALGTALYAHFQTELYVPPPCVRGRVPRNAFGNLDVYVPSMVPPGGVHIRDTRARLAARLLAIDYADAVTGFTFRGRHGTAVVEGVVVAKEFEDAINAVLDGFADLEREDEEARRSMEALRMWKKFLLGLRVLERVQEYASADEKKQREKEVRERIEAEEREQKMSAQEEEMAGGFLLAEGADLAPAQPTAGRMMAAADDYAVEEYYDGGGGGGFLPEDVDEQGEGRTDDMFKSRIMEDAPWRPRIVEHGLDGTDDGDEPMDGGVFVPDEDSGPAVDEPNKGGGRLIPGDGGGFAPEEPGEGGGSVPEEGGGFVAEEGGGFIPEEDEGDSVGFTGEGVSQKSMQTAQPAISGAGDLQLSSQRVDIDNNASEKQQYTGQQDEETQAEASTALNSATSSASQLPTDNSLLRLEQQVDVRSPETTGQLSVQGANVQDLGIADGDEEEEDADSLPSHDPEDEDAEPEWLAEEVVSD
ncbi:hypothetical protein B0J12DRAFT_401229 [Macrophomina phaseolina]|uniref:DNA repair protein Rad4 n=1 Tax=Macrophomina phaseolina TaxID=35725 RepID=A0ABQ8GIB5_9PEZI|nr:hypothetical protein B0J12DRAFT_401229 [Macrophomina phaseolina]